MDFYAIVAWSHTLFSPTCRVASVIWHCEWQISKIEKNCNWFKLFELSCFTHSTSLSIENYLVLSCNVSVKSKLQHAPLPAPGNPAGDLTFLKISVQSPPYPGQNAVQMPHTGVHSGDQMPPPRGHLTGTKMTEGRRKRLQLSKKIFINITKTEKHC